MDAQTDFNGITSCRRLCPAFMHSLRADAAPTAAGCGFESSSAKQDFFPFTISRNCRANGCRGQHAAGCSRLDGELLFSTAQLCCDLSLVDNNQANGGNYHMNEQFSNNDCYGMASALKTRCLAFSERRCLELA